MAAATIAANMRDSEKKASASLSSSRGNTSPTCACQTQRRRLLVFVEAPQSVAQCSTWTTSFFFCVERAVLSLRGGARTHLAYYEEGAAAKSLL
jgi:hypothetical protein